MSGGLKAIAMDFGVPMLALSQLRRPPMGGENREPQLTDLRDSGSLEQDASVVIFIHDNKFLIKKNRSGPSDVMIPVEFNGKSVTFREV